MRTLGPALALVLAGGCRTASPAPDQWLETAPARQGVYHTVRAGQTLWRIARAYRVSVERLQEVNDLSDPTAIHPNEKLWIPGATRVLEVPPAPSLVARVPAEPPMRRRRALLVWPVRGVVVSRFGVRDGVEHDGINIAAPLGTLVRVAAGGRVLFSGVERGYGKLILVRHAGGLITIYAHLERCLVPAGARVRQGEVIGAVGKTGRVTGPLLHFEVRERRLPRNPLFFLP